MSAAIAAPPPLAAGSNDFDLSSFLLRQTKLLSLERDEDVESSSAAIAAMSELDRIKAGITLTRLTISDCSQGLYGRCLLTFTPAHAPLLQATQIGVRDIVQIQPKSQSSYQWSDGVVYRITDKSVTVSVEDYVETEARMGQFTLTKLANELVYQRYNTALKTLGDRGVYAVNSRALQVLYSGLTPSSVRLLSNVSVSPAGKENLNLVQIEAITRALSSNDVFCIHGPPGTGKTTTLVELIIQCVARGERVLACAPSNIAVDNLVERIVRASQYNASHAAPNAPSSQQLSALQFQPFQCIRAGHPARLLPSVLSHSLDAVVRHSDGALVTKDIQVELATVQQSINKSRDRTERKSLRTTWKMLQSELKFRERKAVKDVLTGAPVICSTLIGAASQSVQQFQYDTVIIDEAAQAIEAACIIPILLCAKRLILAGDHRQLGPVIKSKEAASQGLTETLFDRLSRSAHANDLFVMLSTQYRMNDTVMQWSSREFYGGELLGSSTVLAQRLTDFPYVKRTALTHSPFVFVDTAGCEMLEDATPSQSQSLNAQSKSNKHEVDLVSHYIKDMVDAGVRMTDITVLSPYLAQIQLLRDSLLPVFSDIEIGTIDSMQGREAECIIISLVRSNDRGEVGFLSDERRLNVAITRAKKQCCLIGDSETLSRDAFLKRMVEYCSDSEAVEYLSGMELLDGAGKTDAANHIAAAIDVAMTQTKPVETKRTKSTAKESLTPASVAPQGGLKVPVSLATDANEERPQASETPKEVFDRDCIEAICRQILDSDAAGEEFAFPPSLSNEERKLVHEVAEAIGGDRLLHESQGKGARRRINLRKAVPTPAMPTSPAVAASTQPNLKQAAAKHPMTAKPAKPTTADRQQQRSAALDRLEAMAKANKSIATAATAAEPKHLLPPAQSQPEPLSAVQPSAFQSLAIDEHDAVEEDEEMYAKKIDEARVSKQPKNKKKQHKVVDESKAADGTEDIDEFLDSLLIGINTCGLPGCGQRVSDFTAAVCSFCHLRHCLKHMSSVLHGCAAQAKDAALARDMRMFHERNAGRSGHGLKEKARLELTAKLHKQADAARKAGEADKKKKG